MIRILYLLDVLDALGGTEKQLRELVRHVDRSRFDPSLVTLYSNSMVDKCEFERLACPVRCLQIRRLLGLDGLQAVMKLVTVIRSERIDIVHTFFPDASIIGPIAAKLAGARAVVGRRDLGYWYTRRYLWTFRRLQRLIDAYIVNSQAVRETVLAAECVDDARLHVVYNGFFDFPKGPSGLSLSIIGLPDDSRIIGTVANLREVKRLDRFIDVAARISDPHAAFLIVGRGDQRDDLLEQGRRAGLEGRFRIMTEVRDVTEVVKLFTIGVLTSESEGLSNALVEYGLAGVPAVAFDVGGNGEVIDDRSTGCLVAPYDLAAMQERIEALLADPATRDRMGAQARIACAARFGGAEMIKHTQAIYAALAERC